MNICIDARSLVEKKVGFGHFLENMLKSILEYDKQNTYYLISDAKIYFDISKYENVKFITYKSGPILKKTFKFYFSISDILKREGIYPNVFWGTMHIMPQKLPKDTVKILTIHDFTHLRFKKSTTIKNRLILKLFFTQSIKNSDEIICISENTNFELKKFYGQYLYGKIIKTIYEGGIFKQGGDSNSVEPIRDKIKKLALFPYILFVGTIEPRKDISTLIDVAEKLEGKLKVIICGKIGWEKKEIIEKLNSTENLIYLNYISENEKDYLMRNCFCQVQPSLYEGFGLPVVESIQNGTIVIVANNSSLKELIKNSYLKFETSNVQDLYDKIIALYNNKMLYNECKRYCAMRGKFFSWEKAAKSYLKEFRDSEKWKENLNYEKNKI